MLNYDEHYELKNEAMRNELSIEYVGVQHRDDILDTYFTHTIDRPPLRFGEEPTVFDHSRSAGRDRVKISTPVLS
tara:strand:- start:402 stop:626 length:225 start_codon:yes stop_codon:yes gene_type:complete